MTDAEALARIATIERHLGGRIGVAIRDTGSGRHFSHRGSEAFAFCSTFKVLAAAAILARVESGHERLDRRIAYGEGDLDNYAPVTGAALRASGPEAGYLSLEALCAAAIIWSDNAAANLMLRAIGGPAALTAYLRGIGDGTSRLDRMEPDLNTAIPGDPRDTTTPTAMVADLDRLLLGDALAPASRTRLEGWMRASTTGTRRLRAGLPADWAVGDKTGTGLNATANVVAILRPPNRAPILAAVYMTGSSRDAEARDTAHAEIGRIVAGLWERGD